MDEYKKAVAADAQALVETQMAARVAHIQSLLATHFATRQPSAVRTAVNTLVRQQLPQIAAHSELSALVGVVGDTVEQALLDLEKLAQWIALLVPRVADGNNFGVEVQLIVLKLIKDTSEKLQKAWDALPDYHSQRATAVEKLNAKRSVEKSVSTVATETKGGKDGDETKSVVTTTDKDATTTGTTPVDDWVAHVVAVDVKWYANLARQLEAVRDAYALVLDRIEKNKDKISLPRGQDRGAYSMY